MDDPDVDAVMQHHHDIADRMVTLWLNEEGHSYCSAMTAEFDEVTDDAALVACLIGHIQTLLDSVRTLAAELNDGNGFESAAETWADYLTWQRSADESV